MLTESEHPTLSKLVSYQATVEEQSHIANYLRERSWQIVATAKSGHLGGPSSSSELLTALYFGGHLKIDLNDNQSDYRDRVMIRGHLAPLRYSLFNLLGWVEDEELNHYRELGCRLQGHESMDTIPGIDVTPAGALGMVLSYGVGTAVDAKIQGKNYKSIVFLGDGEEQEGNVSEAARHAAALRLDNLICIIDKNEKQLSRLTQDVDAGDLVQIWKGYGWEVFEIADGHNLEEINIVYAKVLNSCSRQPRVIIAHTIKGFGLPGATENCCGYHTIHAIGAENLTKFLATRDIPDTDTIRIAVSQIKQVSFDIETISRRKGHNPVEFFIPQQNYGDSLENDLSGLFTQTAKLMAQGYPIYAMTADLMPTYETKVYGLEGRERYLDVGIREQHMFAMAHSLSVSDPKARILVMSHDAFLYRAADQIRAISLGRSRVIVFGAYGGLGGNLNGETHQSIGQIATVMMMPEAIVFEPADHQDFWRVVNYSLVNNPGLAYIRLYSKEAKPLPKIDSNIWFYRSHEPKATPHLVLVSAGLTAHDTYVAGKRLEEEMSIPTRVINVVGLNATQRSEFTSLFEPDIPVLTVYNGNPLILESLVSMAVMKYTCRRPSVIEGHGFTKGTSGSMDDLKRYFKLDSDGIIEKAKQLLLRSGSQVA